MSTWENVHVTEGGEKQDSTIYIIYSLLSKYYTHPEINVARLPVKEFSMSNTLGVFFFISNFSTMNLY